MLKTPEESLEIQCCGGAGCGKVVGEAPKQKRMCIATDCQGWRWSIARMDAERIEIIRAVADEIKDRTPSRKKARDLVDADPAKYGLPAEPTHGYCGLARRPES